MKISELMDEYCELNLYVDQSARLHRTVVNGFIDLFGDIDIRDIERDTLITWKNHYFSSVSRESFRTYLRHLRVLFNYAVEEKYIDENIFRKLKVPPGYSNRKKFVDDEVYIQALTTISSRPQRYHPSTSWYIITKTFASMGMRVRQLTTLEWRDIDFKRETILYRAEGSKTYREQLVPLPDSLKNDLKYYQQYLIDCVYVDGGYESLENEQVFNVTLLNKRYKGTRTSVEQVSGFYKRLSQDLGKRITPKRLRHSFASKVDGLDNASVFSLMALMTHTNVSTTQRYVSPSYEKMKRVIDSIKYQ